MDKNNKKGQALSLIRHDADPTALFDRIVGAVMFRAIFSDMPMEKAMICEITKIVTRGLMPACKEPVLKDPQA